MRKKTTIWINEYTLKTTLVSTTINFAIGLKVPNNEWGEERPKEEKDN